MKNLVKLVGIIVIIAIVVIGMVACEEYDPYSDIYVIRIVNIPNDAKWGWEYFQSKTTITIYRPNQGSKPGTYVAISDRIDFGEDWFQYEMFTEQPSGGWAIGEGSGAHYHGDGGPFNIMLKYWSINDGDVELYVKNKTIKYGINKIPYSDFASW